MTAPALHPLPNAQAAAHRLLDLLRPYCDRIEIAGSIRREKPFVKDIELVMIPKVGLSPQVDLFGESIGQCNLLMERLNQLVSEGVITKRLDANGVGRWRQRYQAAELDGIPVDLFSVIPPADWGIIMAIRTGPREFGCRLVTTQDQGGFLPNELKVEGGQLRSRYIQSSKMVIPCPEEADFFRKLGFKGVPPPSQRGREAQ